ncbi:hypothetical protein ACHAPI_005894 [Fusarium lateritium]
MSSQTIRLRLVIRRHSVPEVKLVWPCVATEDLTVSKLVALVNEVVPLESGDWGLEDYVVELPDEKGDSFELLHFQPVGKVLKQDDQVLIRSLSTDDLRRRRLSGRHQISYDGKHLIDGLAFGRPWLRAPRDRPALDLPPRKRARITHEEESDEDDASYADEDAQSEQLLLEDSTPSTADESGSVRLRARFVDIDHLDDETDFQTTGNVLLQPAVDENDDEEEGSEISDDDELDDDLSDELRLLQEDNALVEQVPQEQQSLSEGLSENEDQDLQDLPPTNGFDVSWLDKMTSLRAAFPLTSISTISDELERNGKDLRTTYHTLAATNKPIISYDEAMERALLGPGIEEPQSLGQQSSDAEESDSQVLRFPGQPEPANPTRPLIQEVDDEQFPLSASIGVSNETSRPLISVVQEEDAEASSSSSSSGSDSDSDSDEDMIEKSELDSDSDSDDSDDFDDDSSDDSANPGLPPSRFDMASSDDSDSSESDSDSDSNSDLSSDSSKAAEALKDSAGSHSDDGSDSSSDSDSSSSDSDSESEPEEISSKKEPQAKQSQAPVVPEPKPVSQAVDSVSKPVEETKPPGAGLTRTKKRNARRRDSKRIKAIQSLEDTQSQPSVNGTTSEEAEFLARKRALLSVVSDENEDAQSPPKDTSVPETRPMIVEVEMEETPASTTNQDAPSAEESSSTQRRHKVDMGAGRRLLLGALGLKNPKSKADEDKLRENLMKDVKPLQNPRLQIVETKPNGVEPIVNQEAEDPEAWRKKISYRAVECCQDDVVLSEPPFPFVQRWDPQQQYSTRKRKRNSQSFNDEIYYEEDSQWNEDGDGEWNDNSQKKKKKKSKKRKGKGAYDGGYDEEEETPEGSYGETGANDDEDIVLNYDDIPSKPSLEDSQFTDMDDLPSLPSDLSTLPGLEFSQTKPGMVITWKQLLLSKATKWQPEMVPTTGLILSISEDRNLHVLLAKRDRDEDDKEYDEHTGQRVYAKFEAPDFDDDNEEEDDGRRDISWTDMSDPRLVQPAPSANNPETNAKSTEVPITKPVQDTDSTAHNKVSTRRDPDETMAEELDTQKVRAEVEADLEEREAAGQPSETDKLTSIPSGQQPPRLELTGDAYDSPISSFIQPMDTPSDMIASPTQQLRETLRAAIVRERISLIHDSAGGSNSNGEEKTEINELGEATPIKNPEEELVQTVEAGWDTIVPDSIPSPELPPLPAKDDISVDHHLLMVPSSAGSVRSGRQPPSVSGLEDLPEERVEGSVGAEMNDESRKRSPSPQISTVSIRSSSPFPSLEDIFHTARQTQSPVKFSQSVPRFVKPEKGDLEYNEAMRKLDEGEEESDRSPDRNKSLRSLFPHSTQSDLKEGSPLRRSFKSEMSKIDVPEVEHIATPPASQKVKREAHFAVPEASQVIELSSSPPSVQFTEDYAQDSEDETYQDEDTPLPQGEGWVQKNLSKVETRSRGKSLPAKATTTTTTMTNKATTVHTRTARGRTSLPPARDVTASAFSQIRGRRKSTRRF